MKDTSSLLNDFEFLGTWWLPEVVDNKVSGTLAFTSEHGVELKLHTPIETGSFDHPFSEQKRLENREFGRVFGPPLIHGVHDDGRPCTIFGAQRVSEHIGGSGARRADYRGTALLFGSHLAWADEALFSTIQVRPTHLEEWLGERPLSQESVGGGEGLPPEGMRLTYLYPPQYTAELTNLGLSVATHPSLHSSISHVDRSVTYQHSNSLTFTSITPKSAEAFLVILNDVRTLLTLLLDTPIYFDQVVADPGRVAVANGQLDQITWHFPQPYKRLRKDLHESEILFSFSAIEERFAEVLRIWLERADSLRAVYELIESVFFGAAKTPHVGLLTLTQAFETLHRTHLPGLYMPDIEEYAKVRSALMAAIPSNVTDDHRDALKNRIKFGNGYSLRKRIDTALNSLGDDVVNLITRKRSHFANRIADTRNYLTHWDAASRGDVIPDCDLAIAAEKFRYFLTVLLLRTLGIPPAETAAAIQKQYRKAWVLEWDNL